MRLNSKISDEVEVYYHLIEVSTANIQGYFTPPEREAHTCQEGKRRKGDDMSMSQKHEVRLSRMDDDKVVYRKTQR